MTAFDPVRFKEQERAGFNLVAERYEAGMALMQTVTARIIELADLQAGAKVLDVATGPGIIARQVAGWVGTNGEVVGIDIAEKALEVARARTADLVQVSYEVMDAENLSYDDGYFDRVVCSFGLMHFPNPDKALAEMRRVLKPGGKLVATVWGEAQDAPFIQIALQVIARNFPPPKVERPSMFRFGEPAVLNKLLAEAGFNKVTTERVNATVTVSDAKDYWRKFLDVAGITAVAFAKQPPEMLEKLEQDTVGDLAPYADGNGYTLVNSVMVATGQAE